EGIASDDDAIYVGFRGPVLRGNLVPLLKLDFDNPKDYDLWFVLLGGLGIRDLTKSNDGFLIFAGPTGGGDRAFWIYSGKGKDCLPADEGTSGTCVKLAEVPGNADGKAEGLCILDEKTDSFDVLVVYDGLKGGGATRLTVSKSQ